MTPSMNRGEGSRNVWDLLARVTSPPWVVIPEKTRGSDSVGGAAQVTHTGQAAQMCAADLASSLCDFP